MKRNRSCQRFSTVLVAILCYFHLFGSVSSAASEAKNKDCTDLARDEETLLVFSTLGGGLTAIDPVTSEIRWMIEDEPAVKVNKAQYPLRRYLPDPRDGSLYQMGDRGDLKKLPYTIPQLVANAPCRSSDGILYSGKKSDTWFMIDPKTGQREKIGDFSEFTEKKEELIGWATSRPVYLGRTQYTVMMFDILSKEKNKIPWNITFYDYASHSMAPEISNDYEYLHLAGSSTGLTVTLDRKHGKFIWQKDLSSPVVAVFILGPEGLLSVPFTTVSDEVLRNIVEESKSNEANNELKLFQSLYIGEHPHGMYAIPSLIDENTVTISSDPPVKLLEGPDKGKINLAKNLVYLNDLFDKQGENAIVFGHYQMPKEDVDNFPLKILPSSAKSPADKELATIRETNIEFLKDDEKLLLLNGNKRHTIGVQTEEKNFVKSRIGSESYNESYTEKIKLLDKKRITKLINDSKAWLTDEQSGGIHQILLVLILTVIAMFWYLCSTVRELRQHSQNGSQTLSKSSTGSDTNYQDLVDLGNGEIKVGKISFNPSEVLGKGCEGTFVFKGTFEKRQVAVKRLLPECFSFADREVALLRESDAHENVVRYFCTEQDRQFRYIAVELCAATLQDYTEGEYSKDLRQQITVWDVLQQSATGLHHLHTLNIVHRDIKPQNVLISLPDAKGKVRVMISDFGLCKKLNFGKASFSRRSGITGTEGWIAPEMIKGKRATTAVDIFSLGCVFYYVLSEGKHAFGDPLKRQANIISNEYDISYLIEDESESQYILAEQLISDMLSCDGQKRPPARAICNHPLFWNTEKILAFLQDVSDRVEKLQFQTEPLKTLETNGRFVVREDWHLHLDSPITEDLLKYRGYMGASVRDLLRAFRNKRHHYHDLQDEAREILGSIPIEFTSYWIKKFPYLLSHSYHALTICREENPFRSYYDDEYVFKRPEYFLNGEENITLHLSPKLLQKSSPEKKQNRRGAYNFYKNFNALEKLNTIYKKTTENNRTEENGISNTDQLNMNTNRNQNTNNIHNNGFHQFRFRNKGPKHSNRHNINREKKIIWTLPTEQNGPND